MKPKRCECGRYPKTLVVGDLVATRCDNISHRVVPRTRWIKGIRIEAITLWNSGEIVKYDLVRPKKHEDVTKLRSRKRRKQENG